MVGVEDLEGLTEDVLLLGGEAFALFTVALFALHFGFGNGNIMLGK